MGLRRGARLMGILNTSSFVFLSDSVKYFRFQNVFEFGEVW